MDMRVSTSVTRDYPTAEWEESEVKVGAIPGFDISKRGVTRVLIAMVIMLHGFNIPAVVFGYVWPWDGARHYITFFGVAGEGKLATFYSGVTLLVSAVLLWLIAAHKRSRDEFAPHWIGLGGIFALMAMDEMVSIHELSSKVLRAFFHIAAGPLYHAWVIPAMVFLAFMATAYWRFLVALPTRSRMLFVTAGTIYVGGALGMEMVGAAYTAAHGQDLGYGVIATIEEILEMSGIVVFIYGLLDHLERYSPESRILVVA